MHLGCIPTVPVLREMVETGIHEVVAGGGKELFGAMFGPAFIHKDGDWKELLEEVIPRGGREG